MESTATVNAPIATATPLTPALRRMFIAAAAYTFLGLLAGLFYRTLTHSRDFTEPTMLSITHTHLLALGTLVSLIVLVLERLFTLSQSRAFRWFEFLYHGGLLVSVAAMMTRGTLQVVATNPTSPALPGIAGLGHIALTAGFVLLFIALGKALRRIG